MKIKPQRHVDWTKPTHALGLILLLRLILGVWGAWVSQMFPNTEWESRVAIWPPHLLSGDWWHRFWVAPWMRWDSAYYENIVVRGYDLHDGTLAFHPLFPLLAKPFYWLTGNAQLSLLIVATLACCACCVLLARYVAKFYAPQMPSELQNSVVQGAAWALVLGPIGWILLAPYTESTFLAPCIGALWALRERRLWLAGALAALAVLARQQGLVLLLPMAWQCWQMWREKNAEMRFRTLDILALVLPILAYAAYSLFRVVVMGESESGDWLVTLQSWLVSPSTRLVLSGSGLERAVDAVLRHAGFPARLSGRVFAVGELAAGLGDGRAGIMGLQVLAAASARAGNHLHADRCRRRAVFLLVALPQPAAPRFSGLAAADCSFAVRGTRNETYAPLFGSDGDCQLVSLFRLCAPRVGALKA